MPNSEKREFAMMKHVVSQAILLLLTVSFVSTAAADYLDGLAAYVKGDHKTACKEFAALAEQGDAKAQFKLGEMNERGHCGAKDDVAALNWYQKAAEQGNSEAQIYLGVMHYNGKGAPQSDAEALKWYRKAAEQGDAIGMWLIGDMYAKGKGVPQSDAEAVNWYRKAAEKGNSVGQRLLGASYIKGQGVPQDHVQAYMWLTLALAKGDPQAADIRYAFASKMSAEQIAEARRLAAQWRPVKAKAGK